MKMIRLFARKLRIGSRPYSFNVVVRQNHMVPEHHLIGTTLLILSEELLDMPLIPDMEKLRETIKELNSVAKQAEDMVDG